MKDLTLLKRLALPLAVAAGIVAAGCSGGGGGGSPSTGGYVLDNGNYQYLVTKAQPNTCWNPSKNVPALPLTEDVKLTANGSTVVITTTAGGTATNFNLTRSGNSLSGGGSQDVDLNPNVACVLHIDASFSGTLTTNDAFSASQVINISEKSGSGCSVLIDPAGTLSNYQFDQLPCSLTPSGNFTRQ